jgi:Flp pilus assembly protein TadG
VSGRLRRCARRLRDEDDDGNAIIEFVYLAVLLMVPLVYVLLTVFRVQGAAYAVSSAAREAGRIYATSESGEDAYERAFAAASVVMADSGFELSRRQLQIDCDDCLQPGARVPVVIDYNVDLPLLPRFLDRSAPASLHVSGHHLEVVDRFRTAP